MRNELSTELIGFIKFIKEFIIEGFFLCDNSKISVHIKMKSNDVMKVSLIDNDSIASSHLIDSIISNDILVYLNEFCKGFSNYTVEYG